MATRQSSRWSSAWDWAGLAPEEAQGALPETQGGGLRGGQGLHPDPRQSNTLSLSDSDSPLNFTELGELERFVSQEMVYGEGAFPLLMVTTVYQLAFPSEARHFMDRVGEETSRLRVIVNTRKATVSFFMDNQPA